GGSSRPRGVYTRPEEPIMTHENSRAFRIRPDMRRGLRTEVPLPTRLVSNEEFPPLPQTAAQRAVEDRILAAAGRLAPRLGLRGLRRQARRLNPKLASDRGTLADLSWENFVKEVFLDSETAIGLISTPPGPYPQEAVVPPKEMTHIRDEINRITQSRRMLAHGLITPQLGQADLEFMELQTSTLKVDAWKGYTGAAPRGFDRG